MFSFKIALHTLVYNRRQYISLFLVCLVGVAIMLCSMWVTDGMLEVVHKKSKAYYGGDIMFVGGDNTYDIGDSSKIIEKIKPFLPPDVSFFCRYEYDARDALLFYEGETVRQRIAKGVDFEAEKEIFSGFDFVDGNAEVAPNRNGMLLSQSVANRLGIKAGDMLVYQTYTDKGYRNTVNLVVSGIFRDTSLFGMYTTYIDIKTLRSAIAKPTDFVNRLCLYYKNKLPSKSDIIALQKQLEKEFPMYALTDNKREFYDYMDECVPDGEQLYALISLDANVKDLQLLIEAIKAVVLLVIIVLMTIISVGIASTYKIIVMKRITEVGTYRAIGMKPNGVKALFLVEAFLLLTVGIVAGVLLAFCAVTVLSKFSFSFIPAMDIFLVNGNLLPYVNVVKSSILFLIITVTTVLSMLFTVRNVVHISPVGALATTA